MPFSVSRSSGPAFSAAALLALGAVPAWGEDYFLGAMDQLAVDQPRITFGLTDEDAPGGPAVIGPTNNLALLDTGANGILLGELSFVDGEDYQQAMFNGQPAIYNELGVAGTEPLEVYSPHGFRVVDSYGQEYLIDDDLIAFGGDITLGSFAAIVGMPAMDGRVVDIDMRPNLNLEFQSVGLYDNIGQVGFDSAASFDVDLRMLPPEHTDTALPEAMRPTFAALPVVDNIRLDHAGGANGNGQTQTTSNTFLMDTGAQTMIISESMATSLGIDFENVLAEDGDVIEFLEVGGIGGTALMPMVMVEEFRLPTADGVDLVFTEVFTGVLDIDGAPFDAVVGMNMLTSGYSAALFGGGGGGELTNGTSKDFFDGFVDSGLFFDDIQDVIDQGYITITLAELQELADLQLINSDFTDLSQVYCDLVVLEEAIGSGADGVYFDRVVFDFTATDGTGVMRLDLDTLTQEGDANLDGFVGTEDLDLILANWDDAVRAGNVLAGDLTGDGLVNDADLQLVLAHWGEGTDPNTAVPEPASAALLALGLLLLPRRR